MYKVEIQQPCKVTADHKIMATLIWPFTKVVQVIFFKSTEECQEFFRRANPQGAELHLTHINS